MATRVILPATTVEEASGRTFAQAKAWVAQSVGGRGDTDTLSRAGEMIWAAIQEWNTRHAFSWLEKTHTNITVTGGDATYDLPSDFRIEYDVRLTSSSKRPLFKLHMRHYDRTAWDQTANSTPTHYTLFSYGQGAGITLLPTPSAADVLSIKYYAPISEPTNDTDTLNIPKRWYWGVLYLAKALLLSDYDSEPKRLMYWEARAEKFFQKARADDMTSPDMDDHFVPAQQWATRSYPESHPMHWLEGG